LGASERGPRALEHGGSDRTLAQVKEEQGERALVDHCVPLDPDFWKTDNYRAFLEYRRAELAKAINEFIGGEFDQAISTDIDTLLAQGEGDGLEFKSSGREKQRFGRPESRRKTAAFGLNASWRLAGGIQLRALSRSSMRQLT